MKMETLSLRSVKVGWEAIWVKVLVREEGDVSCERSVSEVEMGRFCVKGGRVWEEREGKSGIGR